MAKEKEEKKEKEHPIIAQYKAAYDVSEKYTAKLNADILKKGFVGKKVEGKTIDDIVGFLHSEDVAEMMKKALGSKAKDLSTEELLQRYGLPKHTIKELLSEYESVTPEALLSLIQQLGARLHAELVSHHPAAFSNLAYEKGVKAAQEVLMRLYEVSGGEKFAESHKKTIDNLVDPSKIQEHVQTAYQQRVLHGEMARHTDRLRKAVYEEKGDSYKK